MDPNTQHRLNVRIALQRTDKPNAYDHDYRKVAEMEVNTDLAGLTRNEVIDKVIATVTAAFAATDYEWPVLFTPGQGFTPAPELDRDEDITQQFADADALLAKVESDPTPVPAYPWEASPEPAAETPLGETIDSGTEEADDKLDPADLF